MPEEELERGHSGALWGVVLLALGIFMIISYFSTEGTVVAFFANLVKGLVGWGFWLTVPVFLYAGAILLFEREHPVGHRVACALLLPTIFSGMAELIHPAEVDIFSRIQTPVSNLYSTGKLMESAGVLGGYLGKLLVRAFSIYGAFPFLLVLFILFLIITLRGTLAGSLSGVRKAAARQREAYWENREREPELDEMSLRSGARSGRRRRAGNRSRGRRPTYSVWTSPWGGRGRELSLRGPSRQTARAESAPKRTPVRRKVEEKPVPKVETFQIPVENDPILEQAEASYPVISKASAAPQPRIPVVPHRSQHRGSHRGDRGPSQEDEEGRNWKGGGRGGGGWPAPRGQPDYEFPPIDLLRSSTGAAVDARDEIQPER